VQRAPVRTVVGVQWERLFVAAFREAGLAVWFLGSGRARVDAAGPTLMEGMDGVTEIEGGCALFLGAAGSLMEIVGTEGVTEIDGGWTFIPGVAGSSTLIVGIDGAFTFLSAELTEIDGVSWTEIVGMGAVADGLERAEGA
jgi:hypothetical protein